MFNALVWSFDVITNINWLEVVKSLAPVATAFIAFVALRNWKRQDKAKREAEFLDILVEATHTYLAEMERPVTLAEIAKIGMQSHIPTWESGDEAGKAAKGAIAYIQKDGVEFAKKMQESLEGAQPSFVKLKSLVVKGQLFQFVGYENCLEAVASLTWQFERIAALTATIGSPTLNWEHPLVLDRLKKVSSIDVEELRVELQERNVDVIKFASATYKKIYG